MGYNSKYTGAQVEEILDNTKSYSANDILTKLKTVDGEDSGLNADLLDGIHLNELFTSLSSGSTNKLSITIGGVTKSLETLYASYTDRFRAVWNNPTSGTYDLNDFLGGYVRHYESGGSLSNAPSNFGNGAVLALTNGTKGLSGQLAWNIVHNSTTNVTNKLWWRAADSTNGFTYSQWKQIAFTDSNVESATKLETARTIWGQSFDGTGNVSGNMSEVGTISMSDVLTLTGTAQSTARIVMSRSGYNYFNYPTDGKLCFGTSNTGASTQLFIDGATGNVGVGTVEPTAKLHVAGKSHLKGTIYVTNADATTAVEDSGKIKFNSLNTRDDYRSPYIQAIHQANYSRKRLSIFQSNATNYTDDFVEVFTILPNGNTGIGTASPAYKLDVNGDIHTSGTLTQDSDIRLKDINKDILLSIEDIANAPLFEFTYKSDDDKRIHVGTSAQYWIERNNWFCKKQNNGYYDMEIQNLALASAISIAKEFKKYKEKTESTIDNMKKEIEELKQIILNINK